MSTTLVQESSSISETEVKERPLEEINLKKGEPLPPELWPQVEHLVTEDDIPVDNIFSERQQRLLVESLYISWPEAGMKQPFVALANVGLFYKINEPPVVPDMLLSLNVSLPDEVWQKRHRSYFIWEYGKPPEVVVEIVSNQKGEEDDKKLHEYADMGVAFYIIFDPEEHLKHGTLRAYERVGHLYKIIESNWLHSVGIGLTLWQGKYEGLKGTWLRWCDRENNLLLTGAEQKILERQRIGKERQRAEEALQTAEKERQRAEQLDKKAEEALQAAEKERQRAEEERKRTEQLLAQLKEHGIEPEKI